MYLKLAALVAGQSIRTGLLFEAAAGDTISSIARRFGRTSTEVAAMNPHAAALGVEPGTLVCVLPDVAGNDGCPPPGVATSVYAVSQKSNGF